MSVPTYEDVLANAATEFCTVHLSVIPHRNWSFWSDCENLVLNRFSSDSQWVCTKMVVRFLETVAKLGRSRGLAYHTGTLWYLTVCFTTRKLTIIIVLR